MENENEICGVCFLPFDSNDRTPRVLVNCGHTLCSSCLTQIISTPSLWKCPFDNIAFKETQKSLDHFPKNFALLAVIEGKNQNLCQVHQKKMAILCLQDNVKICSDCIGEHKGHPMKKIEDLKAKAIRVKKDLEESLLKFEKNRKDVEALKRRCLGKVDNKFGEINKLLKAKKLDWKKRVESLFETNIESQLKEEASKTIEEINQICQREENLAVLNRDFSSITSRLQPQVAQEELSKLSDETLKMIDRLKSLLGNQASSDAKGKPEQPVKKEKLKQQQLPSKNLFLEVFKRVETMFTYEFSEESISVSIKNPNSIYRMINITALGKGKRIQVTLGHYSSLSQGSADLNFLSYIFQNSNNCTSLTVSFAPEGLTDSHALCLLDLIFCRIQHLTDIEVCLKKCQITNEPILFFCNNVLPKATSLKNLTLKLGSTLINDESLFALTKSLYLLNENLKSLTLRAENTQTTDEGIEKIFNAIRGVKALRLYLDGTRVKDRSLKVLGKDVMPSMKDLEQFSLDVSKKEITMEGVSAIFTGIPKDIGRLSLSFEGIELSDEVISLFEEKVCPKLGLVDDVHLRLEGRDLKAKVSTILERVRKDADERRKVFEGKKN